MDIYSITIAISIAVFVFIGGYAGRSVKQLDDYFVAGRRAPTLLIVVTLVASVFSTSIFLGEAGFTYDGQMGPYNLFPGIAVVGYVYGALLINYYVIPYQRGAGVLLADGSLNWATGEVVLALASAVLYIPLGLICSRVIWQRYRPLEPGAGANNIL